MDEKTFDRDEQSISVIIPMVLRKKQTYRAREHGGGSVMVRAAIGYNEEVLA